MESWLDLNWIWQLVLTAERLIILRIGRGPMKWSDGLLDSVCKGRSCDESHTICLGWYSGTCERYMSARHLFFSAVWVSAALAFLHSSRILWIRSHTDVCLGNKEGFGSQSNTWKAIYSTCGQTSGGVVSVFNPREVGAPQDGMMSSDTPHTASRSWLALSVWPLVCGW